MRSADPRRPTLARGVAVLWLAIVVGSFYAENGEYFRRKVSDFLGYAFRVIAG